MKFIKKKVDQLKDELDGAEHYAEKFIQERIGGNSERSEIYRKMALQELEHTNNIHQMLVEDIERLRKYVKPTESMLQTWNEAHEEFILKYKKLSDLLSS
jgi:hypothetical protein